MLLKNKICFITGAGRGIGKAILESFIKEEAKIIYANTLTEGSLNEISLKYSNVVPMYFNVSNSEAIQNAIKKIRTECGRLDILVNNAGIVRDELIGMISRKNLEDVFNVNVYSVIELIQAAAKLMMKYKSGNIINVSSCVGINGGNSGQLVYSATKGAIIALTKTAAKELAPYGIRVNAIAPGFIDTEMFNVINKKNIENALLNIPLKRLGKPTEAAEACIYLASDMSSYVTGHILSINGGI